MSSPRLQPKFMAIDPATQLGLMALTIADLERSVTFYTTAFGFTVIRREASTATLGAGGVPLLVLIEHRGAGAKVVRAAGLYHFAILVPERAGLGRWLRHWLDQGVPVPGQGDHLVSEALYLCDPDGNGIEIYRDRPRDQWRWVDGRVQMATDPVDLRGLLAEAEQSGEPWTGLPAGTRLGHIHLQVGDIGQAAAFYHGVLGFDVVAQIPSALFVSAGGYHHHVGLNTWHSLGAGPAPADTAGLRFFSVNLPSEKARAATVDRIAAAGIEYETSAGDIVVRDPWQHAIRLEVGVKA